MENYFKPKKSKSLNYETSFEESDDTIETSRYKPKFKIKMRNRGSSRRPIFEEIDQDEVSVVDVRSRLVQNEGRSCISLYNSIRERNTNTRGYIPYKPKDSKPTLQTRAFMRKICSLRGPSEKSSSRRPDLLNSLYFSPWNRTDRNQAHKPHTELVSSYGKKSYLQRRAVL